mmetsp:Transcript_10888/g.35816  ORF Transcript_10888/g.35816 Transcript_10888/m.35816 type:complete len:314 (-) Transcript_10888:102-1043(-)|eukprot:CAMPEP_0170141536 /NCGR_PEP_ID=MMETSP0033_2-20121228/7056_1 /TAXON_ID=195969 /ORGANISM="Dolichomastix tenuilepis, Strain CCMP3274" /LENGTH=313 /DNA_ID=CAMNT_0010377813 /DNA_START=115 /DNA_END=1056 /DNA_ORIENTATION=-
MPAASKLVKKQKYDSRLRDMLETYERAFLVHADNVGSKQFQTIRAALRPESVVIMGKNTMMKRSIRVYIDETGDTKWEPLLEQLVGNVGLIFTKGELSAVREEILKYKVPAPARVGAIAPCDVVVPAGGTGMGPEATSFFQILNIATKINKGTVEIISDVQVVSTGEKVGSSEAALLAKMKLMPFSYGLVIVQVFDNGSLFAPEVLDITDDDMVKSFGAGVANVAALSLAANYPTLASVPHSIINSYKNVLAISVATDYTFPLAQKVKDYLANPDAFAAAAAPAAGTAAPAAAAAPEPEEEEEEEEMGFDLFD